MVARRIFAVFALALAVTLPQAVQTAEKPVAAAVKQCDFQPDIIALSDYVLKHRASLQRFKNLRYGAISAYLKLRYQKLSDKQAEQMLMPLVEARVSRADELMFAWAIRTYGVDAAMAIMGPKSSSLLLTQGYSPSALRAAIAKEGLPALAEQLKTASPADRFRVETALPIALLDRFDTFKDELGRQAEDQGFVQLAAGLAATQSDPGAWSEFASRVKDRPLLLRTISYWRWTPGLLGNAALKGEPIDAPAQLSRDRIHRVMIADAMTPEHAFLSTYVNHRGRPEEGQKVADTIITLAGDKSGPRWTMDRAWISTYLELLAVADDPVQTEAVLSVIPFGGIRHYEGTIRDVLDWMIAVDALTPYMLKQSDSRSRPEQVSAKSRNWESWQAIAGAIREDGDLAPFQTSAVTRAIAAELLFAAGKEHALATFLTGAPADDMTVNLAEDFANRMDRSCYGYLNFPAEAVLYPDTPLFRFD